jgi:hypothetical protein
MILIRRSLTFTLGEQNYFGGPLEEKIRTMIRRKPAHHLLGLKEHLYLFDFAVDRAPIAQNEGEEAICDDLAIRYLLGSPRTSFFASKVEPIANSPAVRFSRPLMEGHTSAG